MGVKVVLMKTCLIEKSLENSVAHCQFAQCCQASPVRSLKFKQWRRSGVIGEALSPLSSKVGCLGFLLQRFEQSQKVVEN